MANRVIEHIRLSSSDEIFDVKDVIAVGFANQIEQLTQKLEALQEKYDALKEIVEQINYNGGQVNPDDGSKDGSNNI